MAARTPALCRGASEMILPTRVRLPQEGLTSMGKGGLETERGEGDKRRRGRQEGRERERRAGERG